MMGAAKAFISVDAEGLPYVPYKGMLMPGDPLYGEMREIMTRTVLVAVKVLHDAGFEPITVADSHGAMVNVDPLRLPGYTVLVRGFPRRLMMVSGAEGSEAAVFLGYHSSPGLGGVLAHTYSGRIVERVDVAGQDDASEYILNAYALGELGVPVILVAGDSTLRGRVEKHTPWAVFIALKERVSSMADASPGWVEIERSLKTGIEEAVRRLRSGEAEPLRPPEPWIRIMFKRPWHADIAELFPCVERLDGLTVRLGCERFTDNLKLLEGLVIAAYSLER